MAARLIGGGRGGCCSMTRSAAAILLEVGVARAAR